MTIYDIAEMAGVSASSVSRVINGKPGVNRKKRAEIEALLHEHHYMPDENARNLVLQENHTVGILTDNLNEDVRMSDGLVRAEYELLRNGYYCFVKYIGKGSNAIEEGQGLGAPPHAGGSFDGCILSQHKGAETGLGTLLARYPSLFCKPEK